MGAHFQETNGATDTTGALQNLHVPGYVGTNAQRLAYITSLLRQSEQWFETDTDDTYQWSGTAWQLLGGDGSVSNTPASSFTMTSSSLVVAGTYYLTGTVTVTLSDTSRLALI